MKSNPDNENKASPSINEVIYAQRKLDIKTIHSLKEIINNLKRDIEDESRKNHFLKLDLNNSHYDNMDLKNQNIVLNEENYKQNKQIVEYKNKIYQDAIYMMVMKIIIGLLMFLVFVY